MSTDASTPGAAAASDWAGIRGKKWVENMAATERMLAPVDAPLLAALGLRQGAGGALRVADIGCGGGHTSRAIAAMLPRGSAVHGIDISPDVIAAASAKESAMEREGIAELTFSCVDAARAAPPSVLYDRLSSRFGVMFFDDPEVAFSNLASWLAPDGRFAFAVWGALADNPWMLLLREVVAQLVELPPPVPDAPGPFRYAKVERFTGLLGNCGFARVEAMPWQGRLDLGGGLNAADAAAFCLSAFSVGAMLDDDPRLVATALAKLTDALGAYEAGGIVRIPAAVHIVTGGRAAHADAR